MRTTACSAEQATSLQWRNEIVQRGASENNEFPPMPAGYIRTSGPENHGPFLFDLSSLH
jgi:hypothetical protein